MNNVAHCYLFYFGGNMSCKLSCLLTGSLLLFTSSVFANHTTKNIMVVAIPDQISATTVGNNIYYTKSFKLDVLNIGGETTNLADGCFVGYDESLQSYYVDLIDDKVAKAVLAEKQNVKGHVAFSSDRSQVHGIQFVRFENDCD
jgi:hypothetical protein